MYAKTVDISGSQVSKRRVYIMENNKNTEKNTQNKPKTELPKVKITKTIREVFNYEKNKKK